MEALGETTAAVFEATVFLDYFREMPDPRQPGKVSYRLDEILLLALMAVLAGAEGFTDIARFGQKKIDLLRRFLPYANGTPSHDHLGDIFASLDPAAFRRCFTAWVGALTKTPVELVAIDGKTSRRSGSKAAGGRGAAGRGKEPIHTVSAFAARQRMVLAQTKVSEKSNEIVAIPALLDMLSIEGAIVTIDAMGCQRAIARKIIERKADYVLALKGNQGTLQDDVALFVAEQKSKGFTDTIVSTDETIDGDHGRIETRCVTVIHDVEWLRERHQWPGLRGVIVVDSRRETRAGSESETRLYLTSSNRSAKQLGPAVRQHWSVENSLHWVMDMTFNDDQCRIRTDNAPENFVTIKHMALNIAGRKKGKDSMRLALKTAAWDDDYLAKLIAP
jgi:predicted transposase YbfD/YdcC